MDMNGATCMCSQHNSIDIQATHAQHRLANVQYNRQLTQSIRTSTPKTFETINKHKNAGQVGWLARTDVG